MSEMLFYNFERFVPGGLGVMYLTLPEVPRTLEGIDQLSFSPEALLVSRHMPGPDLCGSGQTLLVSAIMEGKVTGQEGYKGLLRIFEEQDEHMFEECVQAGMVPLWNDYSFYPSNVDVVREWYVNLTGKEPCYENEAAEIEMFPCLLTPDDMTLSDSMGVFSSLRYAGNITNKWAHDIACGVYGQSIRGCVATVKRAIGNITEGIVGHASMSALTCGLFQSNTDYEEDILSWNCISTCSFEHMRDNPVIVEMRDKNNVLDLWATIWVRFSRKIEASQSEYTMFTSELKSTIDTDIENGSEVASRVKERLSKRESFASYLARDYLTSFLRDSEETGYEEEDYLIDAMTRALGIDYALDAALSGVPMEHVVA